MGIRKLLIHYKLYGSSMDKVSYPALQNALQWRHNECDCVSNHRRHDCFLNRLFEAQIKETSKVRVTGLCEGNSSVNYPHIGPIRRNKFPFDDVIIGYNYLFILGLKLIRVSKREPRSFQGTVSMSGDFCMCYRIWSWLPMPCEKHGPRDSVDKNRGRRPRFLS